MPINADSIQATFVQMQAKLAKIVPEAELKIKAELVYEINKLKKETNAVILGHNYMEPALFHTVPDYVGDSLGLSRIAAKVDNSIIVFCGVEFMAETAKILNPKKTVLLPAKIAGCSLAASIKPDDVINLRKKYPNVPVVTYVNCSAAVKAESDYCCTSANAIQIFKKITSETIIFLPDEYLAKNVANETGKTIICENKTSVKSLTKPNSLQIIGWEGKCEVHEQFTVDDITNIKRQFPDTLVISHPECSPEVVKLSDFSASTSKMSNYVRDTNAKHYLILTECSMADNIIADNPDKDILRLCSIRCPHMNEITLEGVLNSLRNKEREIILPEDIINRAKIALDRMLKG